MKCMQKNFHRNILICVYGFFFCVHIGWDYRMGILSGKKFFPKGMAELQSSEKISLY